MNMQELLIQQREGNSIIYNSDLKFKDALCELIEERAEIANNSFFKRLLDIVFTTLLFVFVFSWLFPLIALIIKLTTKGSVFFRQERLGCNGQKIVCYKFRSMVIESRDIDHHGKFCQAIKNDPRVTKVGCFLRKTSLDELPQFWNVLKGEMSIVGPRPHPDALNRESEKVIKNYELRNYVRPGITGLAQVKGYRGGTPNQRMMQKRINYDLWYITNWDILLDVKIILLTFRHVFVGDENAY